MAATLDVPESQRLIAVSLGKIAASRGQKGGINLHKNLLVATVLNKARAAYMIQHINAVKQRAAAPVALPSSSSSSSPSSPCVEMREQNSVSEPSPSAAGSTATAATSSPAPVAALPSPSFPVSSAAPQSVTPSPEAPSVPEGAAGTCMQVAADSEDKENTPPPPPCRDASPALSPDCEKRLQGEEVVKECKAALAPRDSQHTTPRDYVSRSSCCLLKRRRAMDRDHENVSAPKVRIVEARVSLDPTSTSTSTPTPEPMQCCDSPQISNLVNIFNTSFSGLSGPTAASGGHVAVLSVGQSLLSSVASSSSSSSSSHKLTENLTCAKEMKVGLDSVHQPLVLSV